MWREWVLRVSVLFLLVPGVGEAGETLCLAYSAGGYGYTESVPTTHCDGQYGGADWLGFAEILNEICTPCWCASPVFCLCCPYDDTGSVCDDGFHSAIWSVSRSATDPLEIIGPLPTDHVLYLWLAESEAGPVTGASFSFSGSLAFLGLEPSKGVELHSGSEPTDVLLTFSDCPEAPFLAGAMRVDVPTAVAPDSWGGTKAYFK